MSNLESHQQREVAESSYEYLLGEILSLSYPTKANDQNASITQRLDQLGYDVGYRYQQELILHLLIGLNAFLTTFRLMEKVSANHKYIGTEPLDLVKFICKEFWEEVFRKKVNTYTCSFCTYNT